MPTLGDLKDRADALDSLRRIAAALEELVRLKKEERNGHDVASRNRSDESLERGA